MLMLPIFTLAEADITAMLAHAGTLFTDLSLIVILLIGLPIGFWLIRKVIGLVSGKVR